MALLLAPYCYVKKLYLPAQFTKKIFHEASRLHSESKSASFNIYNSFEDGKEETPPPGYILQLHTLFIAHNGTLSSAPLQSPHRRPHLHQHYQPHLHSFGLNRGANSLEYI